MTTTVDTIWHNGEMKPWAEATTHVMAHAIHYGSSVFEGIRAYASESGPQFFRLDEHIQRLFDSARIYRIPMPWDMETITDACHATVRENGLESAYIRPLAFRGDGGFGMVAGEDCPTEVAVIAISWGALLGEESRDAGVDVCISSWNRMAPNTIPPLAKAGGNYLSGQLIGGEARRRGYAEGIALGVDGLVSEGAGENLFMVRAGRLITPPQSSAILAGITRDTVMTLAGALDIEVIEQSISREALYLADELFMTGTAAEITPIRSVDDMPVGNHGRGPVTKQLQDAFFGLFDGRTEDRHNWLTALKAD